VAVVVIGAGPAGCTAAYRLRRLGHDVTIVEAAERLGGRTWTLCDRGFRIDTGAAFLPSFFTRTHALLRELGRERSLAEVDYVTGYPDGDRLHLVRDGSRTSYLRFPLLTRRDKLMLARLTLKARLARGPDLFDLDGLARADRGETAAELTIRTAGENAYHHAVRPAIERFLICSGSDASAALVLAVLRLPLAMRFYVLVEGMGSLCTWLAEGAEAIAGTRATGLEVTRDRVRVRGDGGLLLDAEGVVIATEAPEAAALLAPADPLDPLARVPYVPSTHVAVGYAESPWAGFPANVVSPAGPGEHPVVTLALMSRKSQSLVPSGAEVVNVYLDARASGRLDADGARRLAADAIARHLPPAPAPVFQHVFRRSRGFPVPRPGQYAAIRAARDAVPARVRLAGDYLSHASVEGPVRAGEAAARSLAATL
jgi:protoporphyrinogen/coproporphyrinogen III oxidase